MDVHTEYAPDYVERCVEVLLATGADNVGGPACTRADGYLQQAICLGYHSPFSTGGARFHDPGYEGYVDTVTYGCWRKERLIELGLFDETLVRNQDDELNLRIHRTGGRVFQSTSIRSWYHPRASLAALFRQYMQYGYWKVRVIRKHKQPASWRHLVPGVFVFGLMALTLAALFFHGAGTAWLIVCGTYVTVNALVSLATVARVRMLRVLPVMPAVFAAFHFGYGYGFLRGLVDIVAGGGGKTFSRLTRHPASGAR
ncbi:MAG: glycosyltransferase family 2 protein [Acidobacteria bacterium]|nr:MAG: glycosyltransferase family 2 protein [Acidobacteriota bacterium]